MPRLLTILLAILLTVNNFLQPALHPCLLPTALILFRDFKIDLHRRNTMRRAGVAESCIGIFILALLATIAGGVYFAQSLFDPELYSIALQKQDR